MQYGPSAPMQYGPPLPMQYRPPTTQQGSFISFLMAVFLVGLIWIIFFRRNGSYSSWSDWSECNKQCGGGTKTRTRTYIAAAYGGQDSIDKDNIKEILPCNEEICKINGKMSDWINVNGKCVKSETDPVEILCGTGKLKQKRDYIPASNGGIELNINDPERLKTTQWISCDKEKCTYADGSFSDWLYTGDCVISPTNLTIKTCGDGGVQKQTRTYNPPIGNGKDLTNKTEVMRWSSCKNILPECPQSKDATCSDFVYDTNGCICNANGVYQITKNRNYIPPTGNGRNIDCDTSAITVRCKYLNDSNAIKTEYGTLGMPTGSTPDAKCPSAAIMTNFTSNDDSTCTPLVGKNRYRSSIATYTFPIGSSNQHDSNFSSLFNINDINDIESLTKDTSKPYTNKLNNSDILRVTRTNNTIPQEYRISRDIKCNDIINNSKL
jgi:hypothetical protein